MAKIKVGKMVINTVVNHVVLAIKKKYRENNPEKKREANETYRKNNPEIFREHQKRYRENNPEKKRENNKLYYAINKQSGL